MGQGRHESTGSVSFTKVFWDQLFLSLNRVTHRLALTLPHYFQSTAASVDVAGSHEQDWE